MTLEQIEKILKNVLTTGQGTYGPSKAFVTAYTMFLARTYPNLLSNSVSPGFIDTAMTKGYGAKKTPEEGCVSTFHCLFTDRSKIGNGYYFGSDAKRSPLTRSRDPGTPEYTGEGDP